MVLKKLRVANFRNLTPVQIDLHCGLNLFIGDNAQGKTNILEAAATLADGRSFRGGKIQDMIAYNQEEAAIEGNAASGDLEYNLQLRIGKEGRSYYLNGKMTTDMREYLGIIYFTVFSADFKAIIDGDPQKRRDFLDKGVFSLSPDFLLLLRNYKKILKQRNATLKTNPVNQELLGIYSNQLASIGAIIIEKRLDYLNKLEAHTNLFNQKLSQNKETLRFEYNSSFDLSQVSCTKDYELGIKQKLLELLGREMELGITLAGPHRDDFSVFINNRRIRVYGSQGQKRSCILSMKLAEMELFRLKRGENPILILDDIASELDLGRQKSLIEMIPQNIQILMSLTEKNKVYNREMMSVFQVKDGLIRKTPESHSPVA
jgi:DNA replication and repair protein RecF